MANLTLKSIATMIADQAAAVQSSARALVDFSKGSVLLAYAEANASIGAWLQGIVLQVLAVTRLSTSTGTDVDSFLNDWNTGRISAALSAGNVTFSRFTPTNAALVPVGAGVQTADGTQSFVVIADSTNAAWSPDSLGYLLPASIASVTVPVQSLTPGTTANVAAGVVNVMTTNIVGVDYVTNALPFAGGTNSESDAQAKGRFPNYIASFSKGTIAAITYAITSLQLGLQCTIIENQSPDGTPMAGFLWITVDDGTGVPSTAVLNAAALAAGATRAGGINWGVFPPTVLSVAVAMTITTAPGFDHNTVVAAVAAAVTAYVNGLPLGAALPYSMLAATAYAASPGVKNVTSVALNNGADDIASGLNNVVKLTSLSVA